MGTSYGNWRSNDETKHHISLKVPAAGPRVHRPGHLYSDCITRSGCIGASDQQAYRPMHIHKDKHHPLALTDDHVSYDLSSLASASLPDGGAFSSVWQTGQVPPGTRATGIVESREETSQATAAQMVESKLVSRCACASCSCSGCCKRQRLRRHGSGNKAWVDWTGLTRGMEAKRNSWVVVPPPASDFRKQVGAGHDGFLGQVMMDSFLLFCDLLPWILDRQKEKQWSLSRVEGAPPEDRARYHPPAGHSGTFSSTLVMDPYLFSNDDGQGTCQPTANGSEPSPCGTRLDAGTALMVKQRRPYGPCHATGLSEGNRFFEAAGEV
ncbi:hypothetical protein G7046_g8178 [Stylonectria norvegica]|nr:hypothetical protein G7046_g8178 [Stylonectria norvegica]